MTQDELREKVAVALGKYLINWAGGRDAVDRAIAIVRQEQRDEDARLIEVSAPAAAALIRKGTT